MLRLIGKDGKLQTLIVIFIVALFVLRDIFGVSISSTIITAIIAISLIILPYSKAVEFAFFIFPLTCGIPGYNVLFAYIIIVARSRKYNIWQFLPVAIFSIIELFHVTLAEVQINYIGTISFLSFIAIFFFLLFNEDNRLDTKGCIRMFIYSSLIMLTIMYARIIINEGIEMITTGALRGGMAFGVEDGEEIEMKGKVILLNANSIAYFAITSFSLLLMGRKWLQISPITYPVLLALSVLIGIFTFSRTFIILSVILLLLYIICTKQKTIAIILILISIACAIYFYASTLENIMEGFSGRFDEKDVTGGRIDIFKQYNEIWSSKILYIIFGLGATCYKSMLHFDLSMHNATQQIYVSYGMIGIIVFITVILAFRKRYIGKNTTLIYFIPFITCFIFSQSIQFWDPYYLIFPYLATAYALKSSNNIVPEYYPNFKR